MNSNTFWTAVVIVGIWYFFLKDRNKPTLTVIDGGLNNLVNPGASGCE